MATKPRVYIDSCCWIDIVKSAVGATLTAKEENDVWFLKKLLELHRDGKLIVHTSVLAVAECLAVEKGQADVPQEVRDRFRALLSNGQYVHLLNPTPQTVRFVQIFRWEHKLVLGGADAIHLASALERGCTEFLTGDARLKTDKMAKAIPVLSTLGMRMTAPFGTKLLPDESRQMDGFEPRTIN